MTLTQTAILTKQVIVISLVTFFVGILAFVGYNIWHAYYLAHLPPVEEKPDTKFGLLPPLDFPKSNVTSSNFSYSLDTTTGGLPKVGIDPGFEKIIKVYFLIHTVATLLSPDRSTALAEKFGISTLPQILSDTQYKFKDQTKNLSMDLDTGNFSYTNEATISAQTMDDDNKLITGFTQTLSGLGLFKDDLRNARSKVTHEINSESTQISLWPQNVDQKTILTADFDKSLITARVRGDSSDIENYESLDFTYYPIDASTFATYPLKASEIAFDDLKNGKGVVIVEPKKAQVSITSVTLGYYLPQVYTPYLQPVYVFEGPDFVAYVDAISGEFKAKQN